MTSRPSTQQTNSQRYPDLQTREPRSSSAMLVSRRLCWASLSSKSVISTVRGMPFLRNNWVALKQLSCFSNNGETKILDDEIPVPDEIGYEKRFNRQCSQ